MGFKKSRSPVACWYSTRPQRVESDSLTDEWSASGLRSQFQPPSAHCQPTKDSASLTTRGSSARPNRLQTASAFPSWDAHLRYLPLILGIRSEEHTSELQSLTNLVCRLLLEKKNVPTARVVRRSIVLSACPRASWRSFS